MVEGENTDAMGGTSEKKAEKQNNKPPTTKKRTAGGEKDRETSAGNGEIVDKRTRGKGAGGKRSSATDTRARGVDRRLTGGRSVLQVLDHENSTKKTSEESISR